MRRIKIGHLTSSSSRVGETEFLELVLSWKLESNTNQTPHIISHMGRHEVRCAVQSVQKYKCSAVLSNVLLVQYRHSNPGSYCPLPLFHIIWSQKTMFHKKSFTSFFFDWIFEIEDIKKRPAVGGLFFLLETAKVQKYPNQLVPQISIQAKSKSEFLRFDIIDWNSDYDIFKRPIRGVTVIWSDQSSSGITTDYSSDDHSDQGPVHIFLGTMDIGGSPLIQKNL